MWTYLEGLRIEDADANRPSARISNTHLPLCVAAVFAVFSFDVVVEAVVVVVVVAVVAAAAVSASSMTRLHRKMMKRPNLPLLFCLLSA